MRHRKSLACDSYFYLCVLSFLWPQWISISGGVESLKLKLIVIVKFIGLLLCFYGKFSFCNFIFVQLPTCLIVLFFPV